MAANNVSQSELEQLRRKAAWFDAVLDNAPINIYLKAPDGTFLWVNEKFAETFGKPAEDFIGKAATGHLAGDESELASDHDRRVLATGRAEAQEEELMGRVFHFLKCPVTDAEGNIVAIVGFDTDISDLRRAEQALREHAETFERRVKEQTKELRESEQRFKDFGSIATDWFWESDENGRYTYFLESFQQVTGLDPNYFIGKTRPETKPRGVDDDTWKKLLEDTAAHREYHNVILSRIKPDGEEIWQSISVMPRFDETNKFIGYRGTGSDVRQLLESESRKRAAQEALDQIPFGIIIVDGHAKVKFLNQTARHIVDEKDGLLIRKDTIFTGKPKYRGHLLEIIRSTIEGAKNNYNLPNEVMILPRTSRDEPLSVMICSLWGNHLRFGLKKADEPLAVLFITASERQLVAHAQTLQNLFGLTKAEANITEKLVAGKTLEEIANELNISKHTPRKHLKSIFEKTGTNSQVQLLKLVMSTPVWFGSANLS